ncbi:orotate phosphoribosyltransferase [Nocardia sp. MW-W600-9]
MEATMQDSGKLTIYTPTAERIARTMVSSDAYLLNVDDFFTWKSGVKAPVYTDCRVMLRHAGGRSMIKKALGSATLSNFGIPDYVIGVSEAGIVWSTLVADELHTRTAFVRKQAKSHGIGGLVAGVPERPDRLDGITAVIVDDLVASGESLVHAITAIREEVGLEAIGVVSIVNWDFLAMRDRFRELRVPLACLVSYPQLLQAAFEDKRIDNDQREELLRFYRNPRGHVWSGRFGGNNVSDLSRGELG